MNLSNVLGAPPYPRWVTWSGFPVVFFLLFVLGYCLSAWVILRRDINVFSKILIAHRGEIPCRVIWTALRIGIKTIVCSDVSV